jgi:clan AA aspartic protease (TIGR02281 family)
MRAPSTLGAAFCLLLAASSQAEIYSWTDAQGTIHFAQDLTHVPPQHREAARRRAHEDRGPSRVQTYSAPSPSPRARSRSRDRTVRIPFQKHGTLMRVEAELNGWLRAPFLVDSGASGVSIPQHVADRLGLRIGPETRWVETHTANGVVARPIVKLESVRVGEARVDNLEATIHPSMMIGLLGGSFFNNFVYRVDAAAHVISLTPNTKVRSGFTESQWRERFRTLSEAIARIDEYVPTLGLSQNQRRAQLAQRREELVQELESLEREADRAQVPDAWRD